MRAFAVAGLLSLLLAPMAAQEPQRAAAKPPEQRPVQVFWLAGQSNMEGQAVVDLDHEQYYNGGRGTLARLLEDPAKAPMLRHLRAPDGRWTTRDDVLVWYRPERGDPKIGPLSIGYAVYPGKHHFGPELQFGHEVGDHLDEQVVLIKTAWGGKSLHRDFRPPRAGGEVGPYYRRMVAEFRAGIADLDEQFAAHGGRGWRLAGFVWFQGWNDMFDAKALAEYEQNLAWLIADVRDEVERPDLPVVIGETGNGKPELGAAQAAVAQRPELKATVAFVPTRQHARPAADSPNVTHGHHWFGNAESYFLIGRDLGRAMVKLMR